MILRRFNWYIRRNILKDLNRVHQRCVNAKSRKLESVCCFYDVNCQYLCLRVLALEIQIAKIYFTFVTSNAVSSKGHRKKNHDFLQYSFCEKRI